ncbi:MAG: serine/threonine protein kinase [Bacteroidia bacterium]|nr:serine/threonine protein kinase [Bacteroidia bacterium]
MNDKYTIIKELGRGGNGIVYEVEDTHGNRYAKKILKNVKNNKSYRRFQDEVEVLMQLKQQKGVIQILDYFFPEKIGKDEFPYYVMPLGISLNNYLEAGNQEEIFEIIFELCDTLDSIHSQDITHRDLKPENILIINNKPVISDFGLANFPKKIRLSSLNEKIGPRWTIAPEMKRISSVAEYKRADIYSFAKTIWIILTNQRQGFDGQYIPNSNISVDKFVNILINKTHLAGKWEYFSIVLLERLLIKATDNNPDNRPNAKEFNESFRYWHSSNNNYFERNPYEWEDALMKIFPVSIALSSSWNNIESIKNILTIVFEQYDNLNHSFYPKRGGDDFENVRILNKEFLIINDRIILKPKVLYFESLNNLDWSYFRIEVEQIEPIYAENVYDEYEETVFLNDKGDYSHEERDDYYECSMYRKGSFLITKKTSRINQLNGEFNAYDGLHNKMTKEEYKSLMIKIKTKFSE